MNDRTQQIEYYVQQPYRVIVERDECDGKDCYIARHPELRGCMAQGNTWEEALASLDDARRDYVAALLEEGIPVPLPSTKQPPAHASRTSTTGWPGFTIGRTVRIGQIT